MKASHVLIAQGVVVFAGLIVALEWFDRIRCPEIHGQAMCVLFDHQADKAAALKKVLTEIPKELK
ncbi:hypothetical protein FOC84_09105 [Achromobacter pestifer]|uniref:Uncharacterized protein n=1 Tax=Achromobacter pestifer TaxID=1353889 RepID=A0A7D4DZA3_9BURK|nr:hypothetical protein [Achromobacter pestifer]QKH35089.1 hypothetical protein FOC84_09105 [Achromobacter pestifer]